MQTVHIGRASHTPWYCGRAPNQGWGLLSQFSSFRYFPYFPLLSKQVLTIEYRVYIWQVSPQLSCGDTCQIWLWFRESSRYFCRIENCAYGEISERSFSNPHPWSRTWPLLTVISPLRERRCFNHHFTRAPCIYTWSEGKVCPLSIVSLSACLLCIRSLEIGMPLQSSLASGVGPLCALVFWYFNSKTAQATQSSLHIALALTKCVQRMLIFYVRVPKNTSDC